MNGRGLEWTERRTMLTWLQRNGRELKMRITTKGRYALRSVLALARLCAGDRPISIKTISELESISPEFLEQIFFKLRRQGLIQSVRGPGGGFFLAKPASAISLKDIIDASGEGLGITPCVCGRLGGDEEACGHEDDCAASRVWQRLGDHIDSYMRSVSLEDMLRQ